MHLLIVLLSMSLIYCKASKSIETRPVVILNKGVGGNTTADLLKRLQVDVIDEKPDLVILMIGTNDMLNSRKMISYETYKSNLTRIVNTIKKNKSEVLLMGSPTVDSVYLFERHDKNLFKETPNKKIDTAIDMVKQVAIEQNVLFFNLNQSFKTKELPKHNEDLYIRNPKNSNAKDGVHPTPLGYKFIAEELYNFLSKEGLVHKYTKIICFGDSITKGSGAKGGGTVTGENYPSFLNKMINNLN